MVILNYRVTQHKWNPIEIYKTRWNKYKQFHVVCYRYFSYLAMATNATAATNNNGLMQKKMECNIGILNNSIYTNIVLKKNEIK